ncbi:transposase [Streptomyces sp. NPDC001307]|uniref:transposase n=1 Tax=Streptomyces sp. NPDC001307 TaxID=3364560 RepID=UPI00367FD87A
MATRTLDRNFAVQALVEAVSRKGAHVLVRVKEHRRLPALEPFADGSYLSRLGAVPVRVIDCGITLRTSQGRRICAYRLVTTLTDPHTHPAAELIRLYHERWEIETSYLEIKSTILGGRVLRAFTPAGVAQEVFALLITYQVLRLARSDATGIRPGQFIHRAEYRPRPARPGRRHLRQHDRGRRRHDRLPDPGRTHARPAHPYPPRVVIRAISKYNARGTVDRTTYKVTISINILTTRAA